MTLLEDTERQLADMGRAKRLALTFTAAAMAAAGVWFGWVEDLEAGIDSTRAKNGQIVKQIAMVDLKKLSNRIEELRRKRMEAAETLQRRRAQLLYLRTEMDRVEKLKFDQGVMADLLDAILKRSVRLGLRIDSIESVEDPLDLTPLLQRKRRVSVEGAGAFAKIVSLSHYIESRPMLAKIDSLDISLDKKGSTTFRIDISTYGVKE